MRINTSILASVFEFSYCVAVVASLAFACIACYPGA